MQQEETLQTEPEEQQIQLELPEEEKEETDDTTEEEVPGC